MYFYYHYYPLCNVTICNLISNIFSLALIIEPKKKKNKYIKIYNKLKYCYIFLDYNNFNKYSIIEYRIEVYNNSQLYVFIFYFTDKIIDST